jgi:AraC family transcriptional regulator
MREIPDLRIKIFGIADYPPGASLGPRQIPDFEIVWIERGDCRWELDDTTYECPAGTVVLCRPGSVDKFIWDPVSMTRHGYLHFEFLEELSEPLPVTRSCQSNDVLRPLLRHAVWLASLSDASSSDLASLALRQALSWFASGHISQSGLVATDNQHPVLLRALRNLQQRWGDGPKVPPTVAEWAAEIGVSRGHLARVCNGQFGVAPQELLRHLRLDHGLMLLARSDLKVQLISELCGFASPFHYSRCCKQVYGYSPRALRQQMMAGGSVPESPVPGLRRIVQQLINLGYHPDVSL